MPARRDGRGHCSGWFHGNAMPELPRQHERWLARPVAPAGWTNRCAKAATPAPRSITTGKSVTPRSLPIPTGPCADCGGPDFRNRTICALYRFSVGHGGLQCEACHGSTHAEFPSTHLNDNLRNIQLQGHAGMMIECTACHVTMPNTPNGGPHGMHTIGQNWVGSHGDCDQLLAGRSAACAICHGTDYRGTVLSRAQADRTLTASFDTNTITVNLYRGAQIGCYLCHNGPGNDNPNNSVPPTVSNVSTNTTNNKAVAMTLPATGSGLTLRIISQRDQRFRGVEQHRGDLFPESGLRRNGHVYLRGLQRPEKLESGHGYGVRGARAIFHKRHRICPAVLSGKLAGSVCGRARRFQQRHAGDLRLELWRWYTAQHKPVRHPHLSTSRHLYLDRDRHRIGKQLGGCRLDCGR